MIPTTWEDARTHETTNGDRANERGRALGCELTGCPSPLAFCPPTFLHSPISFGLGSASALKSNRNRVHLDSRVSLVVSLAVCCQVSRMCVCWRNVSVFMFAFVFLALSLCLCLCIGIRARGDSSPGGRIARCSQERSRPEPRAQAAERELCFSFRPAAARPRTRALNFARSAPFLASSNLGARVRAALQLECASPVRERPPRAAVPLGVGLEI